jgi:hypothetical protein
LAGFAGVGAESSSYMYYINNRQQQLNLNLNLNLWTLEPKEGAAAGQLKATSVAVYQPLLLCLCVCSHVGCDLVAVKGLGGS